MRAIIAARDFRPTRLTPGHDWALEQNAEMIEVGAWMRASHFQQPGEDWLASTDREVLATRSAAGLCDVSTLGKIELTGPDVGVFLDRLYVNMFSTLKPGRVRYGLMLREDGFVFDDGTTARLGADRWVMTTTTAHAGPALAHMEFVHQVLWPELDVQFASVTDQWAQVSVAGPRAREVLEAALQASLPDASLPYMGCAELTALGGPARIFRISFSGELAYEVAVPARSGDMLMRTLMRAGRPMGLTPYGLEALSVMRIEKGHPAGGRADRPDHGGRFGHGADDVGQEGLYRPRHGPAAGLAGSGPARAGGDTPGGARRPHPRRRAFSAGGVRQHDRARPGLAQLRRALALAGRMDRAGLPGGRRGTGGRSGAGL